MGRLALVNNEVRNAHRAQAFPRLICHHDLMTRHGLTQVNRCRNAGHDSAAHATMVGAADIQAHRHFPERARVNDRGPRAECFPESHRGTTVQQSKRLRVAVHGHRRDDALGRLFENHDAEFAVESSELNRPWRLRHDAILLTVHQAKGSAT